MKSILAFDPGYGNIKLYGPSGGVVFQSAVAFDDNTALRRVAGLHIGRPPLSVVTEAGRFRVGEGAHDWGGQYCSCDSWRPVVRAVLENPYLI